MVVVVVVVVVMVVVVVVSVEGGGGGGGVTDDKETKTGRRRRRFTDTIFFLKAGLTPTAAATGPSNIYHLETFPRVYNYIISVSVYKFL